MTHFSNHESKTSHTVQTSHSVRTSQTGSDLKPAWSYPPSVQVDLFNYLKPHQQKAMKPYLRLIKRPYQEKLCTSLLDYLEGNGLDTLTEPVLATLQEEIVRVCGLRPLRVDSRCRIHDSSNPSHEPTRIGTLIKNIFPSFNRVPTSPNL